MDFKEQLNQLLLTTARQNASDLHLSVGRKPTLRIDGRLVPLEKEAVLIPEVAECLVMAMLSDDQRKVFAAKKSLDFSYSFEDRARFRVNVFVQKSFLAAALRLIPAKVRTIEELKLPNILHDFS
jgi:twitching motility protein PilT